MQDMGTGKHRGLRGSGGVLPGGWGAQASTRWWVTLEAILSTPTVDSHLQTMVGSVSPLLWELGGAQGPWGHPLFLIFWGQGRILTSGAR